MQEFEITLETAPEKTELVLIPEQTKLEQIAKQYQKHVPAIECMCIKDTRHLPQIEQPEGFAEQLDILFSAE